MLSSLQLYIELACGRLILLSEFSRTRIVSVGPHSAIEALFESKDDGEAHYKESDTTTNSPEVALRFICIGDSFKVHSEI